MTALYSDNINVAHDTRKKTTAKKRQVGGLFYQFLKLLKAE